MLIEDELEDKISENNQDDMIQINEFKYERERLQRQQELIELKEAIQNNENKNKEEPKEEHK